VIESRPDRLNRKVAYFGFMLVGTCITRDVGRENGGQLAFDAIRGQSGAPNRMGRIDHRLWEPILTVKPTSAIPFR
jgi:hypothetical protein